ncbi:MAG: hypothetical protein Q7S01_02065 [bacterium]|nr:hypothetical protein [bacterium]
MSSPGNEENQGEPLISVARRSIYRKWWFWVIAVPFWLFVALLIYRLPFVLEQEKTQEVVAQIHAQKLTLADVMGENLPPPPDPAQVDATVEGIDANGNGIRDDVELAIFKKYPNEAKIRAAELQYAKALQMELTQVFNSETWVAVAQKRGQGFGCVFDALDGNTDYSKKVTEVEDLVRNTKDRKQKYSNLDAYRTSFKVLSGQDCDVGT